MPIAINTGSGCRFTLAMRRKSGKMKEMVVGSRVRLLDASMVNAVRCLIRPQVASARFQFVVYVRVIERGRWWWW